MNPLAFFFKNPRRVVLWLLAGDWVVLVGSFGLALYFRRYDPSLDIIRLRELHVVPEVVFVFFYALAMLVVFYTRGLYLRKTWLSNWQHAFAILESATWTIFGYLLLRGTTKWTFLVPWRHVILYWYLLMLSGLALHRLVLFPALVSRGLKSGLQRKVALIGDTKLAQRFLARRRRGHGYAFLEPAGIIADGEERLVTTLPRLGRIGDLARITREHRLEGAIICDPDLAYDDLMALIEECVRLFGWVDVHAEKSAVWHSQPNTDHYFDIPFARMTAVSADPAYRTLKRAMDLSGALLALVALSPLLAVVAILVKWTSPGPVFYARERIAQNGRPFKFYKFRSMRVGADRDERRKKEALAHIQGKKACGKIVNEEMITPIGRFIRKWGIDEIPQLWNVIRGDMTLVGPRPLPPEEFAAQDEWQKKRFNITPGCTGLWKVMAAKTGNITFNDTALYDLYYARNMNPLLDIYILMQTAWVILRGRADLR